MQRAVRSILSNSNNNNASSLIVGRVNPMISPVASTQTQMRFSMRERSTKNFFEKRDKQERKAFSLFPQEKRKVNNEFLKQVLTSYKQARRWKPAYQMFQGLAQQRVHPNKEVFRLFLYVVGYRGGEVQKAFSMFRYTGRVIKDTAAYNIMIHMLSHYDFKTNDDVQDYLPTSSFKKAFELYDELTNYQKLRPDALTFNYLLKVCQSELKKNETSSERSENELTFSNEQIAERINFVIEEMINANPSYLQVQKIQQALTSLNVNVSELESKYDNLIQAQKRYAEEYALLKKKKEVEKKIAFEQISEEDPQVVQVFEEYSQFQKQQQQSL